MRKETKYLVLPVSLLLSVLCTSCSTVKVLGDGQRRLVSTKIEVTNDRKYDSSELTPYLKQKADGWNPFLYVYNWENGKGKGWDKFVHKLGVAPVVFDSSLVASSISNVEAHLKYMGYYDSRVEAQIDSSKNKKAKVKYSVTLGKRYKINRISFELPAYNDEFYVDFIKDTSKCLIKKGDYLSEFSLEEESSRGADAMHDKGFYDFNKNYYFFEADTVSVPGFARLNIIVKDRTRNDPVDVSRRMEKYYMGRMTVSYPEDLKIREKVLTDLNMIHSGDLYSDTKIRTLYSRYNSINYFNSVNMQLSPRQGKNIVDCDVQLKRGKTQGFKLGLEASLSTTGLWGISPELTYYHRNIFHGGEILMLSVNTNHQIMNKNSAVRANEVNASASLAFPKFFPFPTRWFAGPDIPKTELKISYNYQNRPEYIRNITSATFGYHGKYRKYLLYQVYPLSLNMVHLPYMDEGFTESIKMTNMSLLNSFMNHLDLGLSSQLYYNTGDNIAMPTDDYWFTRFKFDISGNLMSLFNGFMSEKDGIHYINNVPYSQYVKLEWEIGKTFFWGKNNSQSIAGRFLAGYGKGYGNSTILPFEKRFYSGGANSLRGWVARTVGPGNSKMNAQWVIPNQTGDMKLEANLEYRFNIFWRIYGAAFMDAGNVWEVSYTDNEDVDKYFSFNRFGQSIAADWGVGVRVDFTFFLLRVDFGMRVHDPAKDPGSRWVGPKDWFKSDNHAFHFGVGFPF